MIDINKETLDLIDHRIDELEGRISMWKGMIANHQDDISRLEAAVAIDEGQIRKLEEEKRKINNPFDPTEYDWAKPPMDEEKWKIGDRDESD